MKTPRSVFNSGGVELTGEVRNLTYLYGLADFFSFIFEDTDKLNTMLETTSIGASEIYSKFLQLTSGLTLKGVQEQIGCSLKLILLKDEDQVSGGLPIFTVNQPLREIQNISNRPFLPTEVLEENVDFRIIDSDLTSCKIQFARPISSYKFSRRPVIGGGSEYALWACNVELDEQLMYKNFGNLLGVNPEVSDSQFSDFIYGLYYVYSHGPSLRTLEQGLNLLLGIPLPREEGPVIDIRSKVDTGQYIVITPGEQYLLPRGILPAVQIGEEITFKTAIARWIELKDFQADGKWWLNVSIPSEVINNIPSSQQDRFAREGSRFDELMTKYLFRNTFLVRINIGTFEANKYFQYLPDILSKSKPSYSQPVYVWQIDMSEEEFGQLEELSFDILQVAGRLGSINGVPINTLDIN